MSVCTAVTATTTITITTTITTTTKNPNDSYQKLLTFNKTSASARSISRHMAPVNVHNSAIPGAIPQNRRRPVRDVAFTPIGKASAEKSVTVQKMKKYSKLSIPPYTAIYGGIKKQ